MSVKSENSSRRSHQTNYRSPSILGGPMIVQSADFPYKDSLHSDG